MKIKIHIIIIPQDMTKKVMIIITIIIIHMVTLKDLEKKKEEQKKNIIQKKMITNILIRINSILKILDIKILHMIL